MASSAEQRTQRLDRLRNAVRDYVQEEKKRIDTETSVLQAILDNRRGGQGSANDAVNAASRVAAADLGWFLRGY